MFRFFLNKLSSQRDTGRVEPVAEPDFYIWGGQGVARDTSGGPQTKTENVCVTLAWHLSSVKYSYDC